MPKADYLTRLEGQNKGYKTHFVTSPEDIGFKTNYSLLQNPNKLVIIYEDRNKLGGRDR